MPEWDWTRRVVDHVDLHASDFAESVRFYETILEPLEIPKLFEHDGEACFTHVNVVARTPPTRDLHLCFQARSRGEVDEFHGAGVAAGFASNGEPGYRDYAPGYYAAYLLDPDGNNVEALYRDVGNPGYAPELETAITPVLTVRDATAAVEFYARAFGATETSRAHNAPGQIVAELEVGGARFLVVDETPSAFNVSPEALGGTSVRISLQVDDPDAVAERAVAAGATVVFPIADQPYGLRQGRLADPFGHHWLVGRPLR